MPLVIRRGEEIRLTKMEWGLLETLSEQPRKLQTHRWLLERVWGPGYGDDVDVLRVFISQLRRKISRIRDVRRSSPPIRASVTGGYSDPSVSKTHEMAE
jgi:DNA-binding response OmpR family regulator